MGAAVGLLGSLLAKLPRAALRAVLWLLTHTLYRLRVEGAENVPVSGGALLVCNHLSFLDAVLLLAIVRRDIRFVIYQSIYDHPVVRPWARMTGAIPIAEQSPRETVRSLRQATEAIAAGELVCVFAEGQITRIGRILPFRRGFEFVTWGLQARIIPVNLEGAASSVFSLERGRLLWSAPRQFPCEIVVSFGRPMPANSSAMEVRQAVQELETAAYRHHKQHMRPLPHALVQNARRHPFRLLMADANTPRVSYIAALMKSIYLARRLRSCWAGQRNVGIVLPPSVGGALVNFAASLMGKVPVNLNYTASEQILAEGVRHCEVGTIVTARAFLEKVPLKLPGKVVLLEDVAAQPRWHEKLAALALAWLAPVNWLQRALGAPRRSGGLDDLAAIIFSSGSTGDPKGVMLSHYNLVANIEQMGQVFMLGPEDRILGILPFFHAFGYTVLLWLPPVLGVGAVYHPNPLDARAVGSLTQRNKATLLVATPTFLQNYLRRCQPEEFRSLHYVIVGAEKPSQQLVESFEERFGIAPVEGYGCTECAPVLAVNTRDYRAPGKLQVAAKAGRIGHPLPGVSVRILDPETEQPLPLGEEGLLWVRGPNVMLGYYGEPERTAEVLRDGWYSTGDIAKLDEDGFLTLTDRLARFSKIGGEMVPHLKIESKLQAAAGIAEQVFAVAGVPDENKGERLVVLHTLSEERLRQCLEKFAASNDLPPLWKPRPHNFYRVESLPYLGSGKLDLKKVRDIAAERAAASGKQKVSASLSAP